MMKSLKTILLTGIFALFSCTGGNVNGNNNNGNSSAIPAEAIQALQSKDDLTELLNQIGDSRLVLLGESSHGTSEFYTWRAEISKRLIEEKGFNIIAVEGDWSDAYPLNEYVRGHSGYSNAAGALENFDRWPQWMWANEEVEDLAEWLQGYNEDKESEDQVGFYGLDVYGMWESMEEVLEFLEERDSEAAAEARRAISCFDAYDQDEQAYASAAANSSADCSVEMERLLTLVQELIDEEAPLSEPEFNALQNAFVAVNGEDYYRIAGRSSSASWNSRDRHMTATITRLLNQYGPDSKIIVWEHNTHIGDARATDMANAGMVNVGQLVREEYGKNEVYIVGFGTYRGEVLAAQSWGSEVKVMDVPAAQRDSWEWILHKQSASDKIIFLDRLKDLEFYRQRIGHRAIGVVYDPSAEAGNYVPSIMPERYDAFVFIDRTTALNPL